MPVVEPFLRPNELGPDICYTPPPNCRDADLADGRWIRIRDENGAGGRGGCPRPAQEPGGATESSARVEDAAPHNSHRLSREDPLVRLARSGVVRLGSKGPATYTRPPPEDRLPDAVVAELLNWVRGER